MKITLKGFSDEDETISSNYRVNSEKLDWKVSGFDESKKDRDSNLLKALWNLYKTDEVTWAIVQSISMTTLAEKFEIHNIPEDGAEYKSLWKAFGRAWTSLFGVVRDTLIFGTSFSKINKNRANEFHSLQVLFPLDVTKNENGSETTYEFKKHIFNSDEIFENTFFPSPDSVYGLSALVPAKRAIDRKRDMENSIATAIARHMPRFHVVVKPDSMGRYASEEERKKIGKEFRKMAADSEFVSTDLIDIRVIDTHSTVPQLEDYNMFTLNSILIAGLVPPELVGAITKSGSFATSKSRSNSYLSFILPFYQNALTSNINNQILKNTDAELEILRPESLALEYSK